MILQLERHDGQYPLESILKETDSKFDELKDIVSELSILKDGICFMRSYPQSKFKEKISDSLRKIANENWT